MDQTKAKGMGSFMALIDFSAADIIYTALPLYHVSGYAIGICSVISRGDGCFLVHLLLLFLLLIAMSHCLRE